MAVAPKEITNNMTNDGRNAKALCKERKYNIPVISKRKKIAVKVSTWKNQNNKRPKTAALDAN